MTAHSDHSASSMSRWSICPGCIGLSKQVPRSDTVYSKEGTVAHDLGERCFTGDLLTPSQAFGATVDGIKITAEMIEAVELYVEYVDSLDPTLIGHTLYEKTLPISKANLPKGVKLFGTMDTLYYRDTEDVLTVHVVDFKYGKGISVNAVDNLQQLYYGLAAVYFLMGQKKKLSLYLKKKSIDLTLTIVQPRAKHEDGPIRSWSINGDRLLEFESELEKAVQYTIDNPEQYVLGSHCRFCPGKEICPEYNKTMEDDLAEVDYLKVTANPKDLSPEDFAEALECCDLLEDAIKRHRKFAAKLLEAGESVPGWQMLPTRPSRRWSDESKVRQHLETLSLDPLKLSNLANLSPSAMENVLSPDDFEALESLIVSESSSTRLTYTGPSNEDALKLLL